ncbi:MAG TPA: helix-turn-helix domain-containing protein [Thermoplasmata archaeon]|nr:helix-turn-helix domain-containing protein [Thermoplasmata archaeon]
MRTVTLEFDPDHLEALGVVPPGLFDRYEEIELLDTLRLETGWRLQLLRVRRRGPIRSAAELERESRRIRRMYGFEGFELVERRPRTRDYIVLVRQRNPDPLRRLLALSRGGIAPTTPFRLSADGAIVSFHGEASSIRRVLDRLRRDGLPFRVRRSSARADPGAGGSAGLTPRQRAALGRAWSLGYYAVPRRVTLTRLARVSGQSPPALGKMLRRAEGHLVRDLLARDPSVPAGADDAAAEEPRAGPRRRRSS